MQKLAHFLLYGMVALGLAACQARPPVAVHCVQPELGCADQGVRVHFSAKPVVLTPFMLQVEAAGAKQVSASFRMADMDMGENRYVLQAAPGSNAHWQQRVILPVCITGRSDWLLSLDVDGKQHVFAFSADK